MQQTEHRSFEAADEVRAFPSGHADILNVGDAEIGRLVFEPGWLVQGREADRRHRRLPGAALPVPPGRHDGDSDGRRTEIVAEPGDVTSLPEVTTRGVIGDEPVVVVDWFGASNCMRGMRCRRSHTRSPRRSSRSTSSRSSTPLPTDVRLARRGALDLQPAPRRAVRLRLPDEAERHPGFLQRMVHEDDQQQYGWNWNRVQAQAPDHLPVPREAQGRIDVRGGDRHDPAGVRRAHVRVPLRARGG